MYYYGLQKLNYRAQANTQYRRANITRDTHQCRKFLTQLAISHVASLVLIYWNRNGISRVCDLTAVFAVDHAPIELHSDWLQTATCCMPRYMYLHY